ncbi:hypothetical protein [Streptomyces sp. MZ04]|uniref:hypothetical protein n=1 Tax=Streptomyces sp. MZ04 TaxID=2559236 RepID=UPI00143301FE|nr:hypothetical protein [Streptomyces sp. MZ04]
MTIRVYDVDSRTGKATRERVLVTVEPAGRKRPPPLSSAYPECRCQRCRAYGKDQ